MRVFSSLVRTLTTTLLNEETRVVELLEADYHKKEQVFDSLITHLGDKQAEQLLQEVVGSVINSTGSFSERMALGILADQDYDQVIADIAEAQMVRSMKSSAKKKDDDSSIWPEIRRKYKEQTDGYEKASLWLKEKGFSKEHIHTAIESATSGVREVNPRKAGQLATNSLLQVIIDSKGDLENDRVLRILKDAIWCGGLVFALRPDTVSTYFAGVLNGSPVMTAKDLLLSGLDSSSIVKSWMSVSSRTKGKEPGSDEVAKKYARLVMTLNNGKIIPLLMKNKRLADILTKAQKP